MLIFTKPNLKYTAFFSNIGLGYFYIHTGLNKMDNADGTAGCNGNHYGYGGVCVNDLIIRYEDRLGRGCTTKWLVNYWRVVHGLLDTVGPAEFADTAGWHGFGNANAGCVKESGFDVPNRVRKTVMQNDIPHRKK